jgi:hypothetical protein
MQFSEVQVLVGRQPPVRRRGPISDPKEQTKKSRRGPAPTAKKIGNGFPGVAGHPVRRRFGLLWNQATPSLDPTTFNSCAGAAA